MNFIEYFKLAFFDKNLCKSRRYTAFTLAEVVIVVGIIGIIAELTIPQLMQNVQELQFKSAAKEAYAKSSQVVQQLKIEQGGYLQYYMEGHPFTFKPDFMKFFKVIKDCGNSDCVSASPSSSIYKSLSGDGGDTLDMGNDGQFITTDGMFFNIQQSDGASAPLIIIVDVNGYIKKPNIFGKDTFAFQILNDNLYPMGADNTYLKASTFCNKNASSSRQGLGCMYYVMQGIDY